MDYERPLRAMAAADRAEAKQRAPLIEVFASVQGEGRHVGEPTVFVRTATCPLRCLYCDTPESYEAAARFPVRMGRRQQLEPNPVTGSRAAELVGLVLAANPQHARPLVSLTGGEPLEFPGFVREFGLALRESGARLHLETAAIEPDGLAVCVDAIEHLSADYKLPGTLGAPVGGPAPEADGSYGERHRQCCEIALRSGATVDIKLVLTDAVTDAAVERALERLAPVRQQVQLILQPVTPFGAIERSASPADLVGVLQMAVAAGFEVRLLPQVHKMLQLP